jgi:uncharacterized membrane protein (UPF0182 family)
LKSKVAEQEANGASGATNTQYTGQGGVQLSSCQAPRARARFGDFNLIYSGQVTTQSHPLSA